MYSQKKTAQWYTLGCITSDPTGHVSKGGKPYQTVRVKLFGGLDVSALAGTVEVQKGMYVGVRIEPKKDSLPTYTVFPLHDGARDMIDGAAVYCKAHTSSVVVSEGDMLDEAELPF